MQSALSTGGRLKSPSTSNTRLSVCAIVKARLMAVFVLPSEATDEVTSTESSALSMAEKIQIGAKGSIGFCVPGTCGIIQEQMA